MQAHNMSQNILFYLLFDVILLLIQINWYKIMWQKSAFLLELQLSFHVQLAVLPIVQFFSLLPNTVDVFN